MKKLASVLVVLFTIPIFAKINKPTGFFELGRVKGDLNKDGKEDLVVNWSSCSGDKCDELDDDHPPKIITEAYLHKDGKDQFVLVDQSEGIICFRCGGMKGGTLVGELEITPKGILNVSYTGGSRWAWDHLLKWRLDKENKLVLIGSTYSSFDTVSDDPNDYSPESIGDLVKSDINYSTRQVEYAFVNKKQKAQKANCKLKPDYHVPSFANYKFGHFDTGDQHCPRK